MVKNNYLPALLKLLMSLLLLFFLLFSFYPTIFELKNRNNLTDSKREFILEHNYYWPDYNLYLSKIRQGFEGRLTAKELYTSEIHQGSLIQEFYVILGLIGRFLNLDPNFAYLLGRLIFSTLLLLVIMKLIRSYFSHFWPLIAFLMVVVSGSFPKFLTDASGHLQISRYMEWWSNIDALQRITFIPHILFGQVVSFYLLYHLTCNIQHLTTKKIILFIILGNALGLTFPPSLITLDGVLLLILTLKILAKQNKIFAKGRVFSTLSKISKDTLLIKTGGASEGLPKGATWRLTGESNLDESVRLERRLGHASDRTRQLLFCIFSLPSLLYIFILSKTIPWSALVIFHRTHSLMIPFWEYILGTGPIFFLGLAGAILSIINRDRKFQPLIFWVLVTFFFAVFFTHIKDQSPLRFTQTGLFIPLGILGTYFFQSLFKFASAEFSEISLTEKQSWGNGVPLRRGTPELPEVREIRKPALAALSFSHFFERAKKWEYKKLIIFSILVVYLIGSLYMMKNSLDWQTTWLTQRIRATIPPVPHPPQAMYPLKNWMDGIRFLRDKTDHNEVVLAAITAGNHIPAYSGNTVYFGQSNTYDYERKQLEVNRFFKGEMSQRGAELFLKNGRIKYIFFSLQEKEYTADKPLESFYSFLKTAYTNPLVTIYSL